MFDIGFTEVTLIAVIGLLVIGPERLPRVAREIGLWVGRLRRYVAQVRADIEREVRADELRELVKKPTEELKEAIKETEKSIKEEEKKLEDDLTEDSGTKSTPAVAAAKGEASGESPASAAAAARGANAPGTAPAADAGSEEDSGTTQRKEEKPEAAAAPPPVEDVKARDAESESGSEKVGAPAREAG